MVRKTYFLGMKSRIHCMHSFTYTMSRNKNVQIFELVKLLRTASCYLSHPGAKKISVTTKGSILVHDFSLLKTPSPVLGR